MATHAIRFGMDLQNDPIRLVGDDLNRFRLRIRRLRRRDRACDRTQDNGLGRIEPGCFDHGRCQLRLGLHDIVGDPGPWHRMRILEYSHGVVPEDLRVGGEQQHDIRARALAVRKVA